jgi:DtxR family Mn-dependent transcriptional regulator
MEDYLEVIYELSDGGKGVRVKQIADRLGVSLPSVTSALKTLREAGLVNHERYRAVELTPQGRERADALIRRHDALVRFLTEILLIDVETAEQEACHMEHAIGPTTLQRLVNFLQSVQRCPRGDPRWLGRLHARWRGEPCDDPCEPCVLMLESPLEGVDASEGGNGEALQGLMPLSSLGPGVRCIVRHVRGRGPNRRRLADMGICRGVPLEVEKVAPLGDPIDIKVRGYHLCLRKDEAARILVEPAADSS